jgi:hypothetical protein
MKLLVLVLASVLVACGQSVWIPRPGGFSVTTSYTNRSFRQFWSGKVLGRFPTRYRQHVAAMSVEYGLDERWALDTSFGFTRTGGNPGSLRQLDQGLADTNFGVRYRILDELRSDVAWMPSIAVRVGGIVKGTYTPNRVFSSGDGASGMESSVLFGKSFRGWNAGLFGDVGYRNRSAPVPSDWFGSVGVYRKQGPIVLSTGYRNSQGLSGNNSRANGGTFQALREYVRTVEAGVGIVDRRGVSYQFVVAQVVDGRNTGRSTMLGFATSFAF